MIALDDESQRPSCVTTQSEEFDDSLFAHIHLDTRLVGSNLQGNTFANTTSYLLKMLAYIENNECGIRPEKKARIKDTLAKVKSDFETLGNVDKKIRAAISKIEALHVTRTPTIEQLENDYIKPITTSVLETLKNNGSVLIPGGWNGADGAEGHAMSYQLVRNPDDGSITFMVFNTGDGISHHLQGRSTLKEYVPIMAYKIPQQTSDDNLKQYIQELLGARIKPLCRDITPAPGPDKEDKYEKDKREKQEKDAWKQERIYDSERLYKQMLPKVLALGAEELDPRKLTKVRTQSQISGTCSMRVMMPLLHMQMQGEAFQEFLYQTRLQSLLDYYRIKKQAHELGNPMVQRLLDAATSKLARTTKKYMVRCKGGQPILSEEQGKSTLTLLEKISKELEAHQKPSVTAKALTDPVPLDRTLEQRVIEEIDPRDSRPAPPVIREEEVKIRKEVIPAKTVPDINNYKNPIDFLNAIYEVSNHNADNNIGEAVLLEIEKSLASLPLDPEAIQKYWSNLTPEEAKEAFETLQAIQRLYARYCFTECPYPIASQTATAYTAQLMGAMLLNQYYQQKFTHAAPVFLPFGFPKGDIESVTLDPKWDQRIKELDALTQDIRQKDNTKRGDKIRAQIPDEKAQAEALTIHDKYDFIDLEFLKNVIDSDTLNELDAIKNNTECFDSFENARLNLYALVRGQLEPTTDRLQKAVEQYKMLINFEMLSYETDLVKRGRLDFFNQIPMGKGTLAKTRANMLTMRKNYKPEKIQGSDHSKKFSFQHNADYADAYSHSKGTDIRSFLAMEANGEADKIIFQFPQATWSIEEGTKQSNIRLIEALRVASADLPLSFPIRTLSFICQSSDECRVIATKNFFESNLEFFNDQVYQKEGKEKRIRGRDFQTLFLTNIFTPELLNKHLESNPGFANELIKMIDKGFKYHIQGNEVTEGGVFLFQVTYHLLKYLKNHKRASEFTESIQWLENQDKFLSENIELYQRKVEASHLDSDAKIHNELLQVNLLRRSMGPDKKISFNDIEYLFKAMLKYNIEGGQKEQNQYFYRDITTARALITPQLKQHFESLDQVDQERLVRSLLKDVLIPDLVPDGKYDIKLVYPSVQIQHGTGLPILVDLSRGIVESSGKRFGTFPRKIFTADFIKLFGESSRKGEIVEDSERMIGSFNYQADKDSAQRKYRVIYNKRSQTTTIEMEFNNKWYMRWDQEHPMTPGLRNLDNDRAWWCETNTSIYEATQICTDLKGNHIFHVSMPEEAKERAEALELVRNGVASGWGSIKKTSFCCYETDPNGTKTGRALVNRLSNDDYAKKTYDFFSRFEGPEFLEVWQKKLDKDSPLSLEIRMPRYGISFLGKVNPDTQLMEYFWKENPDLRVRVDDKLLIAGFENCFTLDNIKTGEVVSLIPNREFYVPAGATKKMNKDGEYMALTFDTTMGVSSAVLQTEHHNIPYRGPWQHRNSQHYRLYKVQEKEYTVGTTKFMEPEISGNTTEDTLYLAYLYLAKHQPEKAMQALVKCQKLGGLKGTEEEAILIKRIMLEVPNQDGGKEYVTDRRDAITREPDTIAVQLYAGKLLLDKKLVSFNKPLIPTEKLREIESQRPAEGLDGYQEHQQVLRKRSNLFYNDELSAHIQTAYDQYQSIRGNVTFELQIDPSHELELLEGIYSEPNTSPLNIQNRWKELELMHSARERHILTKKKAIDNTLPDYEQKRLEELNKILRPENQPETQKRREQFKTVAVNIEPLTEQMAEVLANQLLYKSESYKKGKSFYVSKYNKFIPIKNMELEDLICNFKTLYDLAKGDGEKRKEGLESLKIYLEGILKAEERFGQSKGEKAQLCSLLYFIMEHPDAGWPEYEICYSDQKEEVEKHIEKIKAMSKICQQITSFQELGSHYLQIDMRHKISVPEIRSKRITRKKTNTKETISLEPSATAELPKLEVKQTAEANLLFPAATTIAGYNFTQELSLKGLAEDLSTVSVKLETVPDFFQQEDKKKLERAQQLETEIKKIKDELGTIEDKTKEPDRVKKLTTNKRHLENEFYRIREDRFLSAQNKKMAEDLKRGMEINQEKKQREEIYRKHLIPDSPSKVTEQQLLKKKLKEMIDSENKKLTIQVGNMLALADSALHGEKATLETRALLAGKQIKKPSFQELVGLYLQGNSDAIQKRTKLDPKSAEELYQQIHNYLLKKTANQHRERIDKLYDKLEKAVKNSAEYDSTITQLGDQIASQRAYSPQEHPELLVFEYLEELMIRPEQARIIQRLLKKEGDGFSNEIIQLIMGGGKSKVLLPLLALKKAKGTNLSIIVVPASLFETNVADLQATTQRLFGKVGHKFVFDRDTIDGKSCTAKNLEAFYKKISERVRVNQDFIITTAESIQSLQLKYLELMGKGKLTDKEKAEGKKPEGLSEEEHRQAKYLEKILNLIKNQGDALIDECDTVLDIKRELNYTQGGAEAVPEKTLSLIQKLYQMFPSAEIQLSDTERCTLYDILLGKVVISRDEIWDRAFASLVNQLLTHKDSPLSEIAKSLTPAQKIELSAYLLNETEVIPEFVLQGRSDEQRSLIGLMKGEVELFRTCLRRKPNEHYGFPLSSDYPGSKELAIPYLANNTPNERAHFGSVYEIINYTIQLQKQKDKISMNIVEEFIDDYIVKAKDEVAKAYGQLAFENTQAAKKFQEISGLPLQTINRQHKQSMEGYQKTISENETAKDHLILHYILPKIKQYPLILRSNPINHVGQYRSVQAMSGTPWDKKCYHSMFDKADEKDELAAEAESLGTDGQTIDLLRQKNPPVRVSTDKSPKAIIEQRIIRHAETHRIHAFMDIGALFKGITNANIAIELAQALSSRARNQIEFVLFFDESNTLCAQPLKVNPKPPPALVNPITIGGTDPAVIADKLGLPQDSFFNKCFTYYDQRHTTGTDIKQSIDTIGIATVDIDTKARDLWQGVMRLRQLALKQTVEIVVPREVAETNPNVKEWKIDDVIKLVQTNQDQVLGERHLRAALDKMNDVVRQHLLDYVYAVDEKNIEEKRRLSQEFIEVFLTETGQDPFLKFKDCEQWLNTETILNQHAQDCYERFIRLMNQATPVPDLTATRAVKNALDGIKNRATKVCLEYYKHIPKSDQEQTVEASRLKETLKETKKEKEHEKQTQDKSGASPVKIKSWTQLKISPKKLEAGRMYEPESGKATQEYMEIRTLNEMVESTERSETWSFSPNIFVSENYAKTVGYQQNFMNQFIKPLNFFIVIQEPGSDVLKTMLITQEEASEFKKYFEENRDALLKEGYKLWIRSPHNDQLIGSAPDITHQDYPKILEEIQFFNGDLDMLSDCARLDWLIERNGEKMEFMKDVTLRNYPEKKKFLARFENVMEKQFDKIRQDSKVEAEALFKAVNEQDLKSLDALLIELNKIQDPKFKGLILNQKSKLDGLSLLSTAVRNGNLAIVKRLLQDENIQENPRIEESSLRLALKQPNAEIFNLIVSDPRLVPKANDLKNWADLFQRVYKHFIQNKDKNYIIPFMDAMKSALMSGPYSYQVDRLMQEKFKELHTLEQETANDFLSIFERAKGEPTVWKDYLQSLVDTAFDQKDAKPFDQNKVLKMLNEWRENPPTPIVAAYMHPQYSYHDYGRRLLYDSLNVFRNNVLFNHFIQDKLFMPPVEDIESWFFLFDSVKRSSNTAAFAALVQSIAMNFDANARAKLFSFVYTNLNTTDPYDRLPRGLDLQSLVSAGLSSNNPDANEVNTLSILLKIYPLSEDTKTWSEMIETLRQRPQGVILKLFEAMLSRPFSEIEAHIKGLFDKLLEKKDFNTLQALAGQLYQKGHQKVLLGANFKTVGDALLQHAITTQRWDLVDQYLNAGFDIQEKQANEMLMWAVENKKHEVLKKALSMRVNPNMLDKNKEPLIVTAIRNIDLDSVKLLLDANADIQTAKATDGTSAIALAFLPEHADIGRLLLQRAGDSFSEHYQGYILDYAKKAVIAGNENSLKTLTQFKLLRNDYYHNDFQVLLGIALENKNETLISFLIQQGASISPDHLEKAFKEQNEEMILLLIKHGVTLNADHLFQAIDMGSLSVMRGILETAQGQGLVNSPSTQHNLAEYEVTTPLYYALSQGKEETAIILLEKGASPNSILTDEFNKFYISESLLTKAISNGKTELAKVLISKGADVNFKSPINNQTPLLLAIEQGNTEIVQVLIAEGANVNIKTASNQTLLSLAIEKGNKDIISALLKSPDLQPAQCQEQMMYAAMNGNHELLKMLSESEKIDLKDPVNQLMMASASGDLKSFREAIRANTTRADALPMDQFINQVDQNGSTPLMWAASIGKPDHVTLVQLMLGPDIKPHLGINQQNKNGETALMFAAREGKNQVVRLLLQAPNIDINIQDNSNKTALDLALEVQGPDGDEVASALVMKGAHFTEKDLIKAIKLGHQSLVKALIEKNCSVNTPDAGNKTPLLIALETGNVESLQVLLQAGANPNIAKAEPAEARVDPYAPIDDGLGWTPIPTPETPAFDPAFGTAPPIVPSNEPASDEEDEPPVRRSAAFMEHAQKIAAERKAAQEAAERAQALAAARQPDDKDTLLMAAIRFGKNDIAKILIEQGIGKGIDFNAINGRGETANDICKKLDQNELLELIQQAAVKQAAAAEEAKAREEARAKEAAERPQGFS